MRFSGFRVWRAVAWMLLAATLAISVPPAWLRGADAWRDWQARCVDPVAATEEEQRAIVSALLSGHQIGLLPPPWPDGTPAQATPDTRR